MLSFHEDETLEYLSDFICQFDESVCHIRTNEWIFFNGKGILFFKRNGIKIFRNYVGGFFEW